MNSSRLINISQDQLRHNEHLSWKSRQGISLLELMIVISTIGILSTLAVTRLGPAIRQKRAITEMKTISHFIQATRVMHEKTTREITGSSCSACFCWNSGPASVNCQNAMKTAMQSLNYVQAIKGPWGDYYQLDENEGEFQASPCRQDILLSYDRDQEHYIIVVIPNYSCLPEVCSEWYC